MFYLCTLNKQLKTKIMSSKFNMKSAQHQPKQTWEYSSMIVKEDKEEGKRDKKYGETLLAKKLSIESKSLEEVSFRDIYQFPFQKAKYGSWVYDANFNFIFQFEFNNKNTQEKIIQILNGELVEFHRQDAKLENGYIMININGDWLNAILIRGWGNLTGCGAYNLDGEYASRIQDTLAEYIVEKLTIKKL